jgi:LmbE family N-acetylglucosaminyl deacetylase/CheY-like chemotaxis protein
MNANAKPAHVLLVEDDDVLGPVVIEVLSDVADVQWARSAEEASEILPDEKWDLIVVDVELPGRNGIEFLSEAKRIYPHVATLICSGKASFDYAVAGIRAGADDYLTKPFDPGVLIEKAVELIALTRERRAERPTERVLAVGAHPDDVEIGVGGIMLRHRAAGHDLTILTLTGGERGGEVGVRAQESARAAEMLGARLVHTDLADTSVSDGGLTIGTIQKVIDDVRPTTIYTHSARDVHQDHRNVHSATLVAGRTIPRIYCYQSPSSTVEFHPTRFVTIDKYIDRKIEVIGAYESQVRIRDYLDADLLRATARYWSRFAHARYVEPLEVARHSDSADTGSLPTVATPAQPDAG